jgi:peptide/nickel transport system substrate-binding protein
MIRRKLHNCRSVKRAGSNNSLWLLSAFVTMLLGGTEMARGADVDIAKCVKYAGTESAGQVNSLDPAVQPSFQNSLMVNMSYNRLTDRTSDWKVIPELATSWESNSEGTVWTFHLRQGVKFWDGRPFTSADVVYTFKRVLDPATGSEGRTAMSFLKADGIEPDGDYAVKLSLDKPVAELPLRLTIKSVFIVQNGATTEQLRTKGAGTGPFIPVDFKPVQQSWLFVKNPNYWQAGLPKSECMQLFAISEPTSMQAALQTGQIDVAQQVAYATLPVLKADPNIELLSTDAATSVIYTMWVDTPPINDNRVREALKYVIDRKQMVDTILFGYGVPGDDNPIAPSLPYAWRNEYRKQDIPKARQLLQEAGYGSDNPLKLTLYTADVIPGMLNGAQLFREMAAKAGVDIEVIVAPAGEYWANFWLKHPFGSSGWSARPPSEALTQAYLSTVKNAETHWRVPAYDALILKSDTTLDDEARISLYKQAGKMLSLEGGAIIPFFGKIVAAERRNCSGYQPHVEAVRVDVRNVECKR